jgi:lipoate-protein ligase A
MDWHFLNSGFSSGERNMAIDVELAEKVRQGDEEGVLRVYGWDPPAISLGYNQSERELDVERIRRSGIDLVRRPTGGRAILHSEELTYSVVMTSRGKNVLELYNRISLAIVQGLTTLGVNAHLERSQVDFPLEYRRRSSLACFTSSARHEITVGSKKLVGSAQRRYARSDGLEVVLQHGSLLLGPDHRRIVQYVRSEDGDLVRELDEELRRHTTDLLEVTRRRVPYEEAALALRRGFEQTWGIRFITAPVTIAGAPTEGVDA